MERRQLPRFPCRDLQVGARLGGVSRLLVRSETPLRALDFNRAGVGLVSSRALPVGRHIHLTLRFGDMLVNRIEAVVQNCRALDDGYRIGLQFELATPSYMAFATQLIEIEEILAERSRVASAATAA